MTDARTALVRFLNLTGETMRILGAGTIMLKNVRPKVTTHQKRASPTSSVAFVMVVTALVVRLVKARRKNPPQKQRATLTRAALTLL